MHNFEPNTDCGFSNYQTQHRANLQPAKLIRIFSIITRRGVKVHESHHRSHLSVVATLVLPVHQKAKRSHPSAGEASKFTSASKPVKKVLALAAVRQV